MVLPEVVLNSEKVESLITGFPERPKVSKA